MKRLTLHDGWTLRATGGPVPTAIASGTVPAEVPGSVHTDLLTAGLIDDPYLGTNEADLVWVHRASWEYSRGLQEAPPADDERVDLVCEGLDTIAEVSVGGLSVGSSRNQHRTYRFDVREALTAAGGENTTLTVAFGSALEAAEAEVARIGGRPGAYPQPLNMVRKMACSFGWDWGPDLQTAGIWKPIRLERWSVARLASVRPIVVIDGKGAAHVSVHIDIERSSPTAGGELAVSARLGDLVVLGSVPANATSTVIEITVENAELWWPHGYGEQPLHDLTVTLGDEEVLGNWERRIGLRTVTLDTSEDRDGTAFTIIINGKPVFIKGANWIPDDHLLTRITREQLARRIDQALGANLNLLRVWGGGIFESEDFYELCDERGVLVWQDFLLACFAYPEEEPHRSEFEAEAREHVARLTAHPSLVIWNGGNENIWGHEDWDWKEALGDLTWGSHYYYDLFPRIVEELAPTTPYCAGSPYSPGKDVSDVHPNDPNHGTFHQWEVWNRIDYTHYRDDIPRFCSEFGFQGPPTWASIERAVRNTDGSLPSKEDDVWLIHQKAEDGNGKLDRGLEPHIGIPEDFTDWHWATQLNQARAVAHAITHYRSWWPRSAGSIVWQLNDCWPVTSWAAIDGDERPKPLWWSMGAAYADRLLTVQPRGEGDDQRDVLAVINDTDQAWEGILRARRERLDGQALASAELRIEVAARSVSLLELPEDVRIPEDPSGEIIVSEFDGERAVHCFVEDIELHLDGDPLDARVETTVGGYLVHVTARSLVKDLSLFVDRLDPKATVDAGLVTLPAGAAVSIRVHSACGDLEEQLTSRPVLRTANDLVRVLETVGGPSA